MSLATVLHDALDGMEIAAALTLAGQIVSPWQPVSAWTAAGSVLSSRVTFGPYERHVDADAVLVQTTGEPDVVPFKIGLPPGSTVDFTLTAAVR